MQAPSTISFWRKIADSVAIKLMERFGVAALLLIGGFVLATGRGMVESVWESKIQGAMQPRFEAAGRRVDTLARDVGDMKSEIREMRLSQREFFGAQMDLDPKFRAAVKCRMMNLRKKRKQKQETEEVLDSLLRQKERGQ